MRPGSIASRCSASRRAQRSGRHTLPGIRSVSAKLILYGGYARGRRLRDEARGGERRWSRPSARAARRGGAFRRVFSMLFLPTGTPEQMEWYDELMRRTTSVEAAVRLIEARGGLDVVAVAPHVKARTLVVHARGDHVVPVEEGRLLAALMPGAACPRRLGEPHTARGRAGLGTVHGRARRLPRHSRDAHAGADVFELSPRELEVLELVAAGLTNDAIAAPARRERAHVERHLSNIYGKLHVSGKPRAPRRRCVPARRDYVLAVTTPRRQICVLAPMRAAAAS